MAKFILRYCFTYWGYYVIILIMENKYSQEIIELSSQLGLEPIIVNLLYSRGYRDYNSIKEFLIPSETTPDAYLMSQMKQAVVRIDQVQQEQGKILIFGDYDCDGICATSILKLYFDSIGVDCDYFIPKRSDGYGLSITAIENVIEEYLPDLIITVDCGITSVEEVEYCQDLGVDIIVTDHHEPKEELPNCIIINPKIDENSPFHDLCGAGVALKLVEALGGVEEARKYLDLATIATVSDVVPMVGVNRNIVYHGLKQINEFKRKSIATLVGACELEKVTSMSIGFRLGPRINAPGRLSMDIDMVEFFTTDDDFILQTVSKKLEEVNNTRQTMTKKVYDEALEMITSAYLRENKIIVLYKPDWSVGILGLVASKLVEEFYRPVILLTDGGEVCKGSARSIDGVNIFKCLSLVSDLLAGFGGHSGAAGMSVTKGNVKAFATAINNACSDLPDELFVKKHHFDLVIEPKQMTKILAKQLELLEPTGECNPAPIITLSTGDCPLTRINSTNHIKGKLNAETDIVGYGKDYVLNMVNLGADVNLYGSVGIKEYKNREYVQFLIENTDISNIDTVRDNALNYAVYLKTGLPKTDINPKQNAYRVSEISKELATDSMFGTVYVAYSKQTADSFLAYLESQGKSQIIKRVSVGVVDRNPLNTLLLLPTKFDGLEMYSSVVFLDSPISSKFVMNLSKRFPDPEFVLIRSFGYSKVFKELVLDDNALTYTASKISEFVQSGKKVASVSELFFSLLSYGYRYSNETFITHFYVLYESGWLKVGDRFTLFAYAKLPVFSTPLLTLVRQIQQFYKR